MKYVLVLFRLGTVRCYESDDGVRRGKHLQWATFKKMKADKKIVLEEKDEIETQERWRVV